MRSISKAAAEEESQSVLAVMETLGVQKVSLFLRPLAAIWLTISFVCVRNVREQKVRLAGMPLESEGGKLRACMRELVRVGGEGNFVSLHENDWVGRCVCIREDLRVAWDTWR